MRPLFLLLALSISALAELEVAGYIGLSMQDYLVKPSEKHPYNLTLEQRLELTYSQDALKAYINLYAQEDSYDFYEDEAEHNQRTFARLDEMYLEYEGDENKFFVGKNIRFWGALEVRNITDVFNPIEFRNDPSAGDKLGAWNVELTHYTDNGELSVIVKLYEQDQKMAAYPYTYYFLPPVISINQNPAIPVHYSETLKTEKGRSYPSTYVKYAASTQWENALDYAVIFEHGYDGQRKFDIDFDFSNQTAAFEQSVYLVNKVMSYNTMVIGSTLLKLEIQAVDVINDSDISDYAHIGLGFEHTLNAVAGSIDLGLIAEYYKYHIFNDSKRSDLELFETMQNDLFTGFRFSFNDIGSSSLIMGTIIDLSYAEQVYSAKYESSVFEGVKMALDYQYINASQNTLTAYHLMGSDPYNPQAKPVDNQRLGVDVSYHF